VIKFNDRIFELGLKTQAWGPLLVSLGVLLAFARSGSTFTASLAVGLVAAGLLVMLVVAWPRGTQNVDDGSADGSVEGLSRVVGQLSRNYNVLRRQATQGFLITMTMMTLGVVAILAGVFGSSIGLQTDAKQLATLGGIVVEVISGTTLLVYRLNFKRLNEVSDRLEENWRILSAHTLVAGLPPERQAEATLMLINALVGRAGSTSLRGEVHA
jgi:hypothetical protein